MALRAGAVLDTVESYDPRTGVWHTEASAAHPPAPCDGGNLPRRGGRGSAVLPTRSRRVSNRVFALRGGHWGRSWQSLHHARAARRAAAVGDKLVVTGGQNDKAIVGQTEVFDGTSWTEAVDMPTPREHSSSGFGWSRISMCLGGRFLGADKNSAAVRPIRPGERDVWTSLPEMPYAHGSFGAAYIDGRIVAMAERSRRRWSAVVDMFDIAEGRWTHAGVVADPAARRGRGRGRQHQCIALTATRTGATVGAL